MVMNAGIRSDHGGCNKLIAFTTIIGLSYGFQWLLNMVYSSRINNCLIGSLRT